MEAEKKAKQIVDTFKSILTQETRTTFLGKSALLCARKYVNGIIEYSELKSGDYKMDYEYQYHKYTSYWYAVLNAV